MAKIKIRPQPGALSELLKRKGMTQMDAKELTGVDRKTLLKIDRGEEVKLETLQKLATKLQVTEEQFRQPTTGEPDAEADVPARLAEPGTVLLRKLDATRLVELLKGAGRIRWELNTQVREEPARKFLEEFEEAVENFRNELNRFKDTSDISLSTQLQRLKTADDIAARFNKLADHRLTLLGGDYLFWECSDEEGEYEYRRWHTIAYTSARVVLLSVEPSSASSRRTRVHQGAIPPKHAPYQGSGRGVDTTIYVDGMELLPEEIPF